MMTRRIVMAIVGAMLGTSACKDLSGNQPLSAGTTDPGVFTTPQGVQQEIDGTRAWFRVATNQFLLASGLFADELVWADSIGGSPLDQRQIPELTDQSAQRDVAGYDTLQNLRVQAALSVESARAYAPNIPAASLGEMFAIQAYAEMMLVDLFCSGIPLSLPRLHADIAYQPGSTTAEVYSHAVTLFDSAAVLAGDSTSILTLARVGKGRALLALGRYADAAQAVHDVHDGDRYRLRAVVGVGPIDGVVAATDFGLFSVANREGGAGLPFKSGGDPRTQSEYVSVLIRDPITGAYSSLAAVHPLKYPQEVGDSSAITIADATEARLIQAEAALAEGDAATWLTTLNTLRTDGTFVVTPNANDAAVMDTTWGFGTASVPGQTAGLKPIVDPGTPDARVDTLFAERAAWLYLTGHRQGDMRRLLRQYHRSVAQVYPTGKYFRTIYYGADVTLPIPAAERANPFFKGCRSRGA